MKENKNIQAREGVHAVFLDIDGTLIAQNKLPRENVEAIAAAQAAGHKVLLNTGRSYAFIPWDSLCGINFDGVCAGCGTYVKIGDEVLHSESLDNSFVAEVIDAHRKSGKVLFIEGESATFLVNMRLYKGTDEFLPPDRFPCYEVESGKQFLSEFGEHKISHFAYLGTEFDEQHKIIWEKNLRVLEHPTYVESAMLGSDKALGIKIALEALGIPHENSIAMGDSSNDIEMLEYAGISVAMGNAPDEVKKACTYVSADASDGGVAQALYKILGL